MDQTSTAMRLFQRRRYCSKRIAILIYWSLRKELRKNEQKVLDAWRMMAPEHEELFRKVHDPEYL
jgi:hypothetical protein